MPKERFFVDSDLSTVSMIEISDKEFHHLTHVMRLDVNDDVEVVNGKGCLCLGKIEELKKKSAIVTIQEKIFKSPPSFQVILAQASPRINRLDFILEKGTELGMSSLWLFPGERSERIKFNEHQIERMRAVTISAMKQCGRLFLPEIVIKPALDKWDALPFKGIYGDVHPDAKSINAAWPTINPTNGVIIFIGPESGFSDAESKKLVQLNAHGVKLHRNILRTDTAALAALSVIEQMIASN